MLQKPKLLTIPGDPNSAMVDIGVYTIDEEESGDSNDSCGEIGVGTSPSSGTLGVSGQSTTDLKMSYTVWCGVCFFLSVTTEGLLEPTEATPNGVNFEIYIGIS